MASLRNRNGTYYAQFYDSNRSPSEKRISLKTKDKSTARAKLAKWERYWELGEVDPWTDDMHALLKPKGKASSLSLSEAKEAFLQSRREMNASENTLRTYKGNIRRLIRAVGDKPLRRLSKADVMKYVQADGIKPDTANKRFRMIRAFLNWHGEAGNLEASPLASANPPRIPKRQPKAVTPEELEAICSEARKDYRRLRENNWVGEGEIIWRIPAWQFAFYVGLRRAEIARLRWRHLDLKRGTITFEEQKNGKQETLPLSEKALKTLEGVRNGDPNDYVFRSPTFEDQERDTECFGNNMSRKFKKYVRCTEGVRDCLSLHDLRRGFCSELARNGASAVQIKRLARHASITTSMRYIEMHDDSMRGVLNGAF